ncbi:MGMT family protein [Paenibacillus yanchengensis]|uniref:MGMT family protein n=1 Tax=Paenibacillus yanchengensis TaxID=2035833 RepID=A0ABW4YGG4_9BACL
MQIFTRKVICIIQHIPAGSVMSYGQVAAIAGSPRAARQVVRILHTMSERYRLPWHRVVNREGKVMLSDMLSRQLQITALREEGVAVDEEGTLELQRYMYQLDSLKWCEILSELCGEEI